MQGWSLTAPAFSIPARCRRGRVGIWGRAAQSRADGKRFPHGSERLCLSASPSRFLWFVSCADTRNEHPENLCADHIRFKKSRTYFLAPAFCEFVSVCCRAGNARPAPPISVPLPTGAGWGPGGGRLKVGLPGRDLLTVAKGFASAPPPAAFFGSFLVRTQEMNTRKIFAQIISASRKVGLTFLHRLSANSQVCAPTLSTPARLLSFRHTGNEHPAKPAEIKSTCWKTGAFLMLTFPGASVHPSLRGYTAWWRRGSPGPARR